MKSKAFFLWLFLVSTLLVIGCSRDQSSVSKLQDKHNKESETVKPALTVSDIEKNAPIRIEEGKFDKVYGWLDSQSIIYTTNEHNSSSVYAYNLKKGTSRLITKIESMITSIDISDSGNYLFIRSSPTESESKITVIKKDGKVVYTDKIAAFDMAVEWNPYNEEEILVTIFTEDWQDQTFELSIPDQTMTKIELPNPFSKWLNKDQLIFLDWDQQSHSLFSDLVKKDLTSGKEKQMLPNIFQLDAFKNTFMTITVDQDKKEEAIYHFYNNNAKMIASFHFPQLTRFSDWLVPYYDYNPLQRDFITFQPMYSGDVDTYKDGFQLYKYRLEGDDNQTLIMDGLENEPLSCSFDGNLCLYGYNFEKLIDLKHKKIIKLIS